MQLTKHQRLFLRESNNLKKLNTAFLLARIAIQEHTSENHNLWSRPITVGIQRLLIVIVSLSQSPILLGKILVPLEMMKYLNILWFSLNHSKGFTWLCPTISFPSLEAQQSRSFFEPTWPWWWRSFWRYDIGAAIARLKPPFGAKSSEGWIKTYAQNNTQRIEKQ